MQIKHECVYSNEVKYLLESNYIIHKIYLQRLSYLVRYFTIANNFYFYLYIAYFSNF